MGSRNFVHPVIAAQISARQPNLLLVLIAIFVPGWLPTQLSSLLIMSHSFRGFVATHDDTYVNTFFVVQMLLILGFTAAFSWRYASAIWVPHALQVRRMAIAAVLTIPLMLYYGAKATTGLHGLVGLLQYPDHAKLIARVYHSVWGVLAYGDRSLLRVVYSSILSFIGPVWEEIIITGFLLNLLLKRCPSIVAILAGSICFASMHIFQFGFGTQLIPIFFMGVTCELIRVTSGSLWLSVIGHFLINLIIFIPKWLVAIVYFGHC